MPLATCKRISFCRGNHPLGFFGYVIFVIPLFLLSIHLHAQRPTLEAGSGAEVVIMDGVLDEAWWVTAPSTDAFLTTVPVQKGTPSYPTILKVVAHPKYVMIGIECKDPQPDEIIRFSKLRDADIDEEDHVKIVIDPFQDGQSGYIFAVNALGARYDALVSNRGEDENEDWDAVWEARTQIHEEGWTAEIKIPIQSINFRKGLDTWGLNVERRLQRNQEVMRWSNPIVGQFFGQTSRAGLLTSLPEFTYGVGLNIRPSLIGRINTFGDERGTSTEGDYSLDVTQRLGSNITASLTVNTDFAETEVDTRQTNLTRFPLFFPEKRTFFLEGADIFEMGFGTGRNTVLPFFSRRIGLVEGNEAPIAYGLKLNGRAGRTSFGGLGVHTKSFDSPDRAYDPTNMGVVRVKHNVLEESSIGFISSVGDPLNRGGSWMAGFDATYQTTKLGGNKNFIAGAWGMYANREDLTEDRTAYGFKVDYPNDKWDAAVTFARIGEDFDPSLGFVPRKGVTYLQGGAQYRPRPKWPLVRQMFFQLYPTYIKNLGGDWQSYSVFTAPVNIRFESGDRFEFNVRPTGENLLVPFEISDGVVIPAGGYHFMRYRIEGELAAKRRLSGQARWWFGSFYEGSLDEVELRLNWNPSPLFGFEFSGQHNAAQLPWGDFTQNLAGLRARLNISPDIQLNSYLQYDTVSRNFGANIRFFWIFSPLGEVFLVLNNNTINEVGNRFALENRQILLKVRYNFRL